jgi:hypothetical protein
MYVFINKLIADITTLFCLNHCWDFTKFKQQKIQNLSISLKTTTTTKTTKNKPTHNNQRSFT